MKIRTLDQVIEKVAEDRIWRIREITMLKGSCLNTSLSERARDVQRRAFIPLAYAHWEGFVKSTGQAYLDFVAGQRLTLSELTPCFQSVYFSIEHSQQLRTEKRHRILDILSQLNDKAESRVHIKTKGVISTQDNLNSAALYDVCRNLGLDPTPFAKYQLFIDSILLGKRNSIAHGENIFITQDNVEDISKNVVNCIDIFRNELENAAINKSYKRVVEPQVA